VAHAEIRARVRQPAIGADRHRRRSNQDCQ
jgi:hypothetical protein